MILGVVVAGCATTANVDHEKEALLRVDREWAQVASEGKDVERIISFWSDDATIIAPGAPVVRGKEAIRNFVQQSLAIPGFHITWRSEQVSISSDGTLGYTIGENAITMSGQDGKPVTVKGRGIAVWRRSPTSDWKCVLDTWNAGPESGAQKRLN